MLFQKILLCMALDEVLSYHFYNPSTHDILTKSSLNNIPSGYKLIPPPKSSRRRVKSQRGNKSGRCTDAGFTCNSPFDKSQTFQYECENDGNCPRDYKCCVQKCFLHKICTKAILQIPSKGGNNNVISSKRPGNCERWPYDCQNPYDYSVTSVFKCDYDRQCPKNFKCCQQSCFLHKICSRITTDVENIDKFVPTTDLITITTTEVDDVYLRTTEAEEYITNAESDLVSEYDYGHNETLTTELTTEIEYENESKPENKTEQSLKPEYDYGDNDEDEDADEDDDEAYYDESEDENDDKRNTTDTPISSAVEDQITSEEESMHIHKVNNTPLELSRGLDTEKNSNKKSLYDKQSTHGVFLTTTKDVYVEKKSTPSVKSPDPNAIIPEYAEYYYYYDDDKHTQ